MNNIKYVIARWTFQLCDYCCLRSNIHTLIMACRSISELDELMLLHKGFDPAVINHVSLTSQLHIISNYWYFFGQLRCQLYITLGSVIDLFLCDRFLIYVWTLLINHWDYFLCFEVLLMTSFNKETSSKM
jgi:hypothetical protein